MELLLHIVGELVQRIAVWRILGTHESGAPRKRPGGSLRRLLYHDSRHERKRRLPSLNESVQNAATGSPREHSTEGQAHRQRAYVKANALPGAPSISGSATEPRPESTVESATPVWTGGIGGRSTIASAKH